MGMHVNNTCGLYADPRIKGFMTDTTVPSYRRVKRD